MTLLNLFKKKKQLEFFHDENGIHQIGGEVPEGFIIPENRFLGGIQYLGKISKADQNLNWLPFDLNLICPIFTDFEALYLDYMDSNEPKIVYPENSEEITSAYDELTIESKIIYEQKLFSTRSFEGINEDNEFEIFGITGNPQPNFEDEPVFIPSCPKSGKKMKFVAQLYGNEHIKYKSKNFQSSDDYFEKLYQYLNFWCDGNLLIFIEPTSKIVYYSISNT